MSRQLICLQCYGNYRENCPTCKVTPLYPDGVLPPVPEPPAVFENAYRVHPYDEAMANDPNCFRGVYPEWNRTAGKKFTQVPNKKDAER